MGSIGDAREETDPAPSDPGLRDPADIVPANGGAARAERIRSTARGVAVRVDSTWLGALWARLLEMEFVDRSIALAAKLFVSFFPMLVVVAAISPTVVREQMMEAMRSRLGMDGASMDLVQQAFATPDATKAATGFFGVLLTVFFGISFTTALQRVYLRAWRRPPGGGVRNKGRGALWVGAVLLFFVLIASFRAIAGTQAGTAMAWIFSFFGGIALWWWTARLMLRGEVRWRALLPTAVTTAVGSSIYAMQSDIWMPTTVRNNFGQFGSFGIGLSLVTFFTGAGFIIVGAAAVGPVLAERDDRIGRWLRAGHPSALEAGAEPPLPGPGRRVRLADAFGRGSRGWGVPGHAPAQTPEQRPPQTDDRSDET
jgi:membrane protein